MRVELTIKYFEPQDTSTLNEWLVKREHQPADVYDLPAVGFVVCHEDTPIAMIFLRRCEGSIGIVEGLASNPEAESHIRHVAIDAAIQCVCDEAKAREMSRLMAWTVDSGTLVRSLERHGFMQLQQTLITKDLEAPSTH